MWQDDERARTAPLDRGGLIAWQVGAGSLCARGERLAVPPGGALLLIDGLAVSTARTRDGREHALGFLLPGDVAAFGDAVSRGVRVLTQSTVAVLDAETLDRLSARHPAAARAMWRATERQLASSRGWTAQLAAGDARQRVAHLFCELYFRFARIGRAQDQAFEFHARLDDIADMAAVSTRSMRRILDGLRAERLIAFQRARVTMLDLEQAAAAARFRAPFAA